MFKIMIIARSERGALTSQVMEFSSSATAEAVIAAILKDADRLDSVEISVVRAYTI